MPAPYKKHMPSDPKARPPFKGAPGASFENIGPYTFLHHGLGQKVTTDAFVLADFVLPLRDSRNIIDIGTGTGIIPFLLAWRTTIPKITGVEVQAGLAQSARDNIETNNLQDRIEIVEKDYRELPDIFPEGCFDLVVSNPPYMKQGEGRLSPVPERAIARAEVMGGLSDLVRVSSHLAGDSGRVCFVYPFRRYSEVLSALGTSGLVPVKVRFVQMGSGKDPSLFLIEASRTGQGPLKEEYIRTCSETSS